MIDPAFAFALIAGLIFYFVPAMIAAGRHHRNSNAILAANLLFGWTMLGWAVALIWALTGSHPDDAAKRQSHDVDRP